MKIINACSEILSVYDNGRFDMEKWKAYMDRFVPGVKESCLRDMQDCVKAGFSWEQSFMPVLNAVAAEKQKIEKTVDVFRQVTEHLDEKILAVFHRSVDADVILYLGLCNGAGWVTELNGRTTILLGIEKIIELDWCNKDMMTALIIHELGHVYQAQYGVFRIHTDDLKERFLWQLFTEGVAMVYEQEVVGDPDYFHQDIKGWKKWCEEHESLILTSFAEDLNTMTQDDQRYFGDWVSFEGYGDTGYYLGTKFVRYMLKNGDFDRIIGYGIGDVKERFERYLEASL